MGSNQPTKLKAPIIILSAPRAGSTLLFETLAKHSELWTVGGESHHIIEHIPALSTVARGYESNCLDVDDADEATVALLRSRFSQAARNNLGQINDGLEGNIRLLEKTPKNALRIPFLRKVFPDAKFIYLVRDPRENMSSIMDGWRSGRFVTYPNITAGNSKWSFLLPDGWQDYKSASLAELARFQWQSANNAIISALRELPQERYAVVTYQDLVKEPKNVIANLTQFLNIAPFTNTLAKLPLSRYTLSIPNKDKWKVNHNAVLEQMPFIQDTHSKISDLLRARGLRSLDLVDVDFQTSDFQTADIQTTIDPVTAKTVGEPQQFAKVSRNAQCPCGSGKKYKQCHGIIVK